MFIDQSHLIADNPPQLNYGIAITDVDRDGKFEIFVAGFGTANGLGAPNLVLKWNGECFVNIADETLADADHMAIGVMACDIDGDGKEEIYVLNTDSFGGHKACTDRLFALGDGWVDLFSLRQNQEALNLTAGRSIVAVDRTGTGYYGMFVANYGGPMRLYELNDEGQIVDVAPEAGVNMVTGGRSLLSFPIVTDNMDIFAGNENGANYLFRNNGDGTFTNIAPQAGITDRFENTRGVAAIDANNDGLLDIVYGNWEGPHRLCVNNGDGSFSNQASEDFSIPTQVRTVIAADFNNDGHEEIFLNNIGQPNRLFSLKGQMKAIDMGDAFEPGGLGTGAAIGDFDGDGQLELIIAHGESGVQPLTLYKAEPNDNNYLRVLPLTQFGAPARGAIVRMQYSGGRQIRAIDAGSGYLCQMEPVAHFGLGDGTIIDYVEIQWPDGQTMLIENPEPNQMITVKHPEPIFMFDF